MNKALRIFLTIICLLMIASIGPSFSQEAYNFDLTWGSQGTGDSQFNGPAGVATDASGSVYVADSGNHRIQKFDSNGNFITKWGSIGQGDGRFDNPRGVAVDSLGNVYVADTFNRRIQKFDSNGNFIRIITKWSPLYEVNFPNGVAVGPLGNVYVLISLSEPSFLSAAPVDSPRIEKFDSNGNFLVKWGSHGEREGEFAYPNGLAADLSGNVYVADTYNHRIQKFDSNSNFVTEWYIPGPFSCLEGIGTDSSGDVYVTTRYCCFLATCPPVVDIFSIWKFDPNGNLTVKWGDLGTGDGQFRSPSGVAVDSSGAVYVVDTGNNRIQKFSLILPSVNLESPPINELFSSCSSNSSPTFSWNVSDSFDDYEVHISPDRNFASIPFEFAVQPPTTQITIPSATWEEIMMIPGASGGAVYWRVIGTKPDGTTTTSAVRTFFVGAEPAGNPDISPTAKRSKPTLTWQTNCNTNFKVWFGSDSNFTKKKYSFHIENPTDDDATFSKTLTPFEWLRIKMLVRNKTGSTIYWYIESWDGLGRYSKTDVMSFVLTD